MNADVVIVGAGPTGVMLACELRLAGVRPLVLERLSEPAGLTKALAIVGRAVDALDHRGLLERFSARAPVGHPPGTHFSLIPLDVSKLDGLGLRGVWIQQPQTEQLLAARAQELDVEVWRGHELTGLRQDGDGVTLDVRGPNGDGQVQARFVVGCDGGSSTVRGAAGIDFPGLPASRLLRLGEITLPEGVTPQDLSFLNPHALALVPLGAGYYRVITSEPYPPNFDRETPITVEELQASIKRVAGAELPIAGTRWLSRFTDASRQAARYREGRVFLAGDAAHIHLPAGGPGLNTSLLDAVNLGWKLAAEINGWAPPGLLESYHTERHAEGARVLLHTRAQGAIALHGDDGQVFALRELLGQIFQYEEPLRHVVALMHALDTRYEMGGEEADRHPLTGRWAPDLSLTTPDGPKRLAELMHPARPVLLDLTDTGAFGGAAEGWADRVEVVTAHCDDPPADALLIRPDGFVAWAGCADKSPQLRHALTTWFGTSAG